MPRCRHGSGASSATTSPPGRCSRSVLALGVVMGHGGLPAALEARFLVAHALLNLLGWIGLTVIGTLVTLWLTMLRTRIADGVELTARWTLPVLLAGVAVAAAGALAGLQLLTAGGVLVYLAGVWRPPRTSRRSGANRPSSSPRPRCWTGRSGWPEPAPARRRHRHGDRLGAGRGPGRLGDRSAAGGVRRPGAAGLSKRYGFIYVARDEFDLRELARVKKASFHRVLVDRQRPRRPVMHSA